MKKEAPKEIALIALFLFSAIFLPFALWTFSPEDYADLARIDPPSEKVHNAFGRAGAFTSRVALLSLGKSAYLLSLLVAAWSAIRFIRQEVPELRYKMIGCAIFVPTLATLDGLLGWGWAASAVPPHNGGLLGAFLASLLSDLFGMGAIPIALLLVAVSAMLATDFLFSPYVLAAVDTFRQGKLRLPGIGEPAPGDASKAAFSASPPPPASPVPRAAVTLDLRPGPVQALPAAPRSAASAPPPSDEDEAKGAEGWEAPQPLPAGETPRKRERARPAAAALPSEASLGEGYLLPPADLLDEPVPLAVTGSEQLVSERSTVLMKALAQFGIEAQVVQVDRGPVVTMYELMPAPGVKVHRIMALENDIAMALKATSIRIIAPIPGKSTVGIEVPNLTRGIVRLRELLSHAPRDAHLPLFFGRDTVGEPLIADLTRMPHLLIAGATGSGKTVCLSTLILSILMSKKPDEAKLILIDPKMVEMSGFADIPHLACPVVTDMKKSTHVLEWAVQEMEARYELMSRAGARHIESYNKIPPADLRARLAVDDPNAVYPEKLPYIVIVVDELADLMMVSANEVETSITRLAQKSRSVGLHIVLATQRPSVDVITGLIKSNLPARIAFQVASKVDSRTILDRNGADKLLGAGDMLFLAPGSLKMTRSQGTYITDEEIRRVVDHVKRQAQPQYEPDLVRIQKLDVGALTAEKDELYEEAVRVVLESQRGSVSLIQRHFGIGYTRAARLIDTMAKDGLLGNYKGSQAREVLMKLEDWDRAQGNKEPVQP